MKHNFLMFLKTYDGDFNRAFRLIKSFNQFNRDNITLYISVPQKDLKMFEQFKSDNIKMISDESYAGEYFATKKYWNLSLGYINQEICKLSFWETGIAKNYLCIDSEVQFIRDFYISDFMADKNTPYTVLVMDKDLSVEKHYQNFWVYREKLVQKIYKSVGLTDRRLRTCHGMQVMNATVLKSLKNNFMKPKKYDYKKLIEISPFEFTWYNAWFQKCGLVREMSVEPFFKTFHHRIEYVLSRFKMISKKDLSRAYVGIILNGNWKKPINEYKSPSALNKIFYKIIKRG